MLRACRLVADTGIHMFGMTFEEALTLFMDNVTNHESDLQNEVKRYISWPGQACSYTVGKLKIIELREKAAKEIGEKFDVRAFHDVILKCSSVPLNVLEEQIDNFIRESLMVTCKATK